MARRGIFIGRMDDHRGGSGITHPSSRSFRAIAQLAVLALLAAVMTIGFVLTPTAPASAETNVTGVPVSFSTTFHAYVGAGETLSADFTKSFQSAGSGPGPDTFTVTDPAGTVAYTCSSAFGSALNSTCNSPATMTSPTAGAWTITTSTPGNNAWDWDITVRNAGGTALSGRVCRPITASSSPTPPPGTCSTG